MNKLLIIIMFLMLGILCLGTVSAACDEYWYFCSGNDIKVMACGVTSAFSSCDSGTNCDVTVNDLVLSAPQSTSVVKSALCKSGQIACPTHLWTAPNCVYPNTCTYYNNDYYGAKKYSCSLVDILDCVDRAQYCSECIIDADCDDSNVCTNDFCDGGLCFNNDANGIDCGTNKVCQNGACVEAADPCAALNCDDQNACTIDGCRSSQCTNEAKTCPVGATCNPTTGACQGDTGCTADKPCQARSGYTVVCNSNGVCEYSRLPCAVYESYDAKAQACKLSLQKLFTVAGFKAAFNDNKLMFSATFLVLILFVALVVVLIRKRNNTGGF